jgi:outer membrane lipoprotein SlyB
MTRSGSTSTLLAALLIAAPLGCATKGQTAALFGTGIGALAGAAIGDSAGALIGGAVGAGAGYLIGRHTYRCERVNMFGQKYLGTCWR